MNFNPIWVKLGVKDGQAIQPCDCGFSKERRSERHILPKDRNEFDVHMSVHRKYISEVQPTRSNVFSIYLFP